MKTPIWLSVLSIVRPYKHICYARCNALKYNFLWLLLKWIPLFSVYHIRRTLWSMKWMWSNMWSMKWMWSNMWSMKWMWSYMWSMKWMWNNMWSMKWMWSNVWSTKWMRSNMWSMMHFENLLCFQNAGHCDLLTDVGRAGKVILSRRAYCSQHRKASNHHANLPLEMYSFTL